MRDIEIKLGFRSFGNSASLLVLAALTFAANALPVMAQTVQINASLNKGMPPSTTVAVNVKRVRIGEHPGKTRMVIDLDRRPSRHTDLSHFIFSDQKTILIEIANLSWPNRFSADQRGTGKLSHYSFQRTETGRGYLQLKANRTVKIDRLFYLEPKAMRSHRVVIDLVNAKVTKAADTEVAKTKISKDASGPSRLTNVNASSEPQNFRQYASLEQISQAGPVPERSRVTLSKMFGEIMRNPGNIELNVRYAKLAEQSGEPRRALAAYERILGSHPGNKMALGEIERLRKALGLETEAGPETNYSIVLGAKYEHNAAHRDSSFLPFDSAASSVSLGAQDERELIGERFRSNARMYGDFHSRYEKGDLLFIGADTGPVFKFSDDISVRPAISVSHARVKFRHLFNSTSILANIDNGAEEALFKSLDLSIGYDDFATRYPGQDGAFFTTGANFALADTNTNEALHLSPHYRYSHTTGQNYAKRNHAYGLKTNYTYPLTDSLSLAPNLGLTYKNYVGNEIDEKNERWDFLTEPGIKLILSDFLIEDSSISIGYGFERNWSNDGDKTYKNHIVGGKIGWLF